MLEGYTPRSMWCRHGIRIGALVALLLVLQFADVAHAGPVEQLVQLAVQPSDPNVMVVRYINGGDGLFVTRDAGKTWSLLCDQALFDPVQTHSGPIAIAGDGTMMMGVFTGMWHDQKNSCGWTTEPIVDKQWVADFATDPNDPNVTYAVTSTGGDGKVNGILKRDASGTWSDLGTKDPILITRLLAVAHAGGVRFYEAAVAGQVMTADGSYKPNYVIRVSDDNGTTWTEHMYGTTDGQLRLQAVDPSNPDRIVIAINKPEGSSTTGADLTDTVRVSSDQGATFTDYLQVTEIGGAPVGSSSTPTPGVAFAPDGRVWIADSGSTSDNTLPRGLWFAQSLDQQATKLPMADYPVQCLAYQNANNTLYACQHWWFGPVDQTTGAFNSMMKVTDVADFVSCPGVDMAMTCKPQLCNAYCGFGHFAQAPVCGAYSDPNCGPLAAEMIGSGGSGGTGAAAAGGAGGSVGGTPGVSTGGVGSGTGGVGGTGAVGTGGASPGVTIGAAGTGATGAPAKKSGCSAMPGAQGSGAGWLGAFGLLGLAALVRRRRSR